MGWAAPLKEVAKAPKADPDTVKQVLPNVRGKRRCVAIVKDEGGSRLREIRFLNSGDGVKLVSSFLPWVTLGFDSRW